MRYLVTGANGYLGRGIVRKLLDDGNDVYAVDFSTELIDSKAKCFSVNLFTVVDPYEYFGRPDILIHLAWRNGFVHNDISHIEDLILHMNFFESMLKAGLKRLCVMGSMHEIGFYEGSIDANTSCNPLNLYGIGKNTLRHITSLLCD